MVRDSDDPGDTSGQFRLYFCRQTEYELFLSFYYRTVVFILLYMLHFNYILIKAPYIHIQVSFSINVLPKKYPNLLKNQSVNDVFHPPYEASGHGNT